MKRVPIVHEGRVEAAAFFVDAGLIGEVEARRRVVALWGRGTRVVRLDDGYLVTVSPPRSVRTDQALGAPLVLDGDALTSAPQLDEGRGDIRHFRHGRLVHSSLEDASSVDVSEWIEIEAFSTVRPEPLGDPPPAAARILEPPSSVRAVLGDKIPPPAEELEELRASIAKSASAGVSDGDERRPATQGQDPPWWVRALDRLQQMFSATEEVEGTAADHPPRQPGPWARALDRWASKLLRMSRLSRILGHRQAQYMKKLLEMLDDNRIEDVLRHAVPLGGGNGGDGGPPRPAWGIPSPRDGLRITAKGGVGSSMMVGDDLYELLRQRYRRIFEKLVREGRIEEAAFVLAELLNETEEAISFLEKHGELVKAAELAEGRHAAPGLIVRQWILAGDWTRAIRIARRHHAFADALLRLGEKHRDEAKTLRLLWADALAEAGQYMGAVDTVWPIEEARQLAIPWMDAAMELGGPAGAKMMVRALSISPKSFERIAPRAMALLDDDDHHALYERQAFGDELASSSANEALTALARPTIRSLYRDAHTHGLTTDRDRLSRLLGIADDNSLRTDLPPLPRPKKKNLTSTFELTIDEGDAGTIDIIDAAMLPNGRFLVTLGEAGTLHLTRDGRTIKHYDQPATYIVVSDEGHRAIVVGARKSTHRLGRLDLVHQRATYWCDAPLQCFAKSFDGWQWFVTTTPTSSLEAIDATARGFETMWHNEDCQAYALARDSKRLAALAGPPLERWTYELPNLTLRARRQVDSGEDEEEVHRLIGPIDPNGRMSIFELPITRPEADDADDEPTLIRSWRIRSLTATAETRHPVSLPPRMSLAGCDQSGPWCVFAESASGHVVVRLMNVDTGFLVARIALGGASNCSLRFADDRHLIIADDRGRLLVFDHHAGVLRRSLRVSA